MADAKFEEVIRLAFETAGTDGIKQAAATLAHMGDVSEEARQQAAGLLDDIGNVEKASAAARQYEQIGKSVLDYQRQISAARTKVLELASAVKESDVPTKGQQRELAKARSTLSALVGEQQRELGTLRTLKTSLDAQGISTRNAAASQKDLAARTATASTNLREMVSNLKRTRDADASLQASLAQAAQKSKRETDQYDDALKKVRGQIDANKQAAARGATQTIGSMEATSGAVSRLRSVLASLTTYFSFRALIDGVKSLLGTGDQFEKFQKQLTNIYGDAAKGQVAFDWVKQFAKDTPLQLDQVMQSFIKLKNFGIDPMNGTLQAAVDQNAKLGGESERLERITLAMGQAFAKGKLQGDDIKQMIEAGVPVWQLLSKVTGKNVQQLQKLSEAGALGTDVMQAFFKQMGKDSAGAAVDQMATLSGQVSNLKDNFQQFQDRVSKKGVLDYFKDQLSKLNDLITKMAQDGRLDKYAQKTSDAIVSIAETAKNATGFLIDHASAIKGLVQSYIAFRSLKFAGSLINLAEGAYNLAKGGRVASVAIKGMTASAGILRGAFILLTGPVGLTIAGLAAFAAVTKVAADATVEFALKHNEGAKKLREQEEKNRILFSQLSEEYGKRAKALEEYALVQVLAADQVAKLTATERKAYEEKLHGHEAYLKAQRKEAELLVASGEASDAWVQHLAEVNAKLAETVQGEKAFAEGAKKAAEAAALGMSLAAVDIAKSLEAVQTSAEQTKQKIDGLFSDFGQKTPEQINDIALAFAKLGSQAGDAGERIRTNIHEAMAQLTEQDLQKLQDGGERAFAAFGLSAKEAAVISESTLQEALSRLGVAAEKWGLSGTDAANANIRAFQIVATNASATAVTIEAAFNQALANATTADDAKKIGEAINQAGVKGKIGFDATARAVAAVENRVRSLQAAVDPLADDFARLGVTSQRSLDAVAAAAKSSFENIVRGAREGKASVSDVRGAFEGYAKAQLDAVQHAESWKRAQVSGALEVQASIYGVADELAGMGVAGLDAGDKMDHGARVAASGWHQAADAADEAAKATDRATSSAEQYGEESSKAAKKSDNDWISHSRTVATLTGLSQTFLKALTDLNSYSATSPRQWREKWNDTVAEWQKQSDSLNEELASLTKQNGAYDELTKRVEALRQQYNYLNDDQLRSLATAQKTLEDNQKRAEDEVRQKGADAAKRIADEQAQQTEQWNKELAAKKAGDPAAAANDGNKRIAIDLSVSASQQPGAVPAQLSPTDVQRIANEVVRVIHIARTSSN